MIAKLCIASNSYYDLTRQEYSFKHRPVIVIGRADDKDYVVLPLSTISRSENRHPHYDLLIDPEKYPEMHLRRICYVRTHKQTTLHRGAFTGQILCDLSKTYPDLLEEIMDRYNGFIRSVNEKMLEIIYPDQPNV